MLETQNILGQKVYTVIAYTVKHRLTGDELYPGVTGTYQWAIGLARMANIRDESQYWTVYKVVGPTNI